MKKANFDMLKNLPVPEGWIENALAIPEQEEKKNAVVPFWKNREVIAAASLVLVSALSLLLYLNFGVKPPVEVKSSAPATEIVWSTDENGETIATEIIVVDDSTTGQDGTQSTEPKSPIEQLIEQIFGTENTSPTSAAGRGRADPKKKTNPTEGGRINPTAKTDPTQSPLSTEKPEESPTTEPPLATSAPETQKPTGSYRPPGDTEFYGMFTLDNSGVVSGGNYAAEETTLFCRIYDSNGNMIGDGGLFSPQRQATILSKYDNGMIVAYYNPVEKGLYITEDVYEYVFYDIHDNELYRDIKFIF